MAITDERTFGGQTQVAPLRRVLVRAPEPVALVRWREFGWLAEPDPAIAVEQHEALCELLRGAGAEVVHATGAVAGDPDAVYVFDPVIVSDDGALLLRPGKEQSASCCLAAIAGAGSASHPNSRHRANTGGSGARTSTRRSGATSVCPPKVRSSVVAICPARTSIRRADIIATLPEPTERGSVTGCTGRVGPSWVPPPGWSRLGR